MTFNLPYFDFSTAPKYKNIKAFKSHLILFSTVFTLLSILMLSYHLNIINTKNSPVAILLFFSRFIEEYIILIFLLSIICNKYIKLISMASLLFVFYVTVNIIQVVSIAISGDFLTKLALDNVEFISSILSSENIKTAVTVILLLLSIPSLATFFIIKKIRLPAVSYEKILFIFLMSLGILLNKNIYSSGEYISERDRILNSKGMKHTASIQAFSKLFGANETLSYRFNQNEISELAQLGFYVNQRNHYPLQKETIYVEKQKFNKSEHRPNIIIIFTEGFSARTSSVYSDKYDNLTPFLFDFAYNQDTMIVTNYYNHTAATYRGLHGQICSIYPKYGKFPPHGNNGGWHDSIYNVPKANYSCLPNMIEKYGYETEYLNAHYKDVSSIDEMMAYIGFDSVVSGEELSKKYLSGVDKKNKHGLTDQQAYEVLINYLKNKKNKEKFFVSMYTLETHAWVDTESYGIKYKNGNNNSLNTIHNMDDAFGKFWEYFKNSEFANNTMIIFTSDHSHYYEKSYIDIMNKYQENDYQKMFVDKIPLLIYSPTVQLPKRYNAGYRTSIDLAPTILRYLGINDKNSFLGNSLHELSGQNASVASFGDNNFLIRDGVIFDVYSIPDEDQKILDLAKRFIKYTQHLKDSNMVYDMSQK